MKSVLYCLTLILAALLLSIGARAATLSDVLEQAAYQQDTANNPTQAIKLYQQVIESETATRQMTALALYNTGLCYEKLKRTTEANQAFGAVVSQYKNVEPYYRLANARLNPVFTPVQPRWQDGERLEYESRVKNVEEVRNYFWTTTTKVNWNGRPAWKLLNRSLSNNGLSMVIVDEKTLRPLYSRAHNPNLARSTATWTESSISVSRVGQEGTKESTFEGAVYDGEQNYWLLRQLAMATGSKMKYQLLSSIVTEKPTPFEIGVEGEEQVQVPAGQFNAYKLSSENGLSNIWIDKNPERYLVKIAGPATSLELRRISTITPGAWRTVKANLGGFSMSIPDEWFSVNRKGDRNHAGTKTVQGKTEGAQVKTQLENIHVLDDDAKLKAQIAVIDIQPLQGYDFDLSVAGRTVDWLQSAQKQLTGYAERADAKVTKTVAGVPAQSTIVDFQDRKEDWILYSTTLVHDTKFVFIGFFTSKANFNEVKPMLDRMLSTAAF